MQEINLYILTSVKGTRAPIGCFLYLLELKKDIEEEKQNYYTRDGRGNEEEISRKRIELIALLAAVNRIIRPCRITLYTEFGDTLDYMRKGYVDNWKSRGWINASNKPPENVDIWQQLEKKLLVHEITEVKEKHKYTLWMQGELKREMEKMKENGIY